MTNSPDELGKSWKELSMFVLKELERLNANCVEFNKEQKRILVDIALLKVKVVLGGTILTFATGVLSWYIRSH